MRFYKYHGTGNDFIILAARDGDALPLEPQDMEELCRRHTGVGADGIIFACPPLGGGDARMRIFNADGSEAEMCGNGIRCLAKYLYEKEGTRGEALLIETLAGCKETRLTVSGGEVVQVEVDMGLPELRSPDIPSPDESSRQGTRTLELPGGEEVTAFCLSMGNPHCVLFVPDVETAPVAQWGPALEHHPLFPRRTNVEFVQVTGPGSLAVRVWERGVGETLACGTGACAAFVAALHLGKGSRSMRVSLRGGELTVGADEAGHVRLAGPAVEVFAGELSPSWRGGPPDG
ncbi:MAG: diaminopimelate epimerase [Actinobacteria bacterium]|nr:diaminopimelate epimerase [Actinomycetota bacterium]